MEIFSSRQLSEPWSCCLLLIAADNRGVARVVCFVRRRANEIGFWPWQSPMQPQSLENSGGLAVAHEWCKPFSPTCWAESQVIDWNSKRMTHIPAPTLKVWLHLVRLTPSPLCFLPVGTHKSQVHL
jgi:hypothetical protein